jgi:phosphatidylserine/phosphatidylglycerophosphate/cardiolipin synthase-like enzyme
VLILVSPWITPLVGTRYPLDEMLDAIRDQAIATYVITRPPAAGNLAHEEAIAKLIGMPSVELRFNPGLHAKIMLAEGPRQAIGLLGSANLTRAGMLGVEVGVLMHGRGQGETLIRDLIDFCTWDLRQSSQLVQSRQPRRR